MGSKSLLRSHSNAVCLLSLQLSLKPTRFESLSNRSAPHFKSNTEISAAVSAFRAWAASAEASAEKFSAPPTPVDFEPYNSSVRDTALVDNLKAFYTSAQPAPETYEWSAEERADKMQQIEDAKARQAFTLEMVEETEAELEFMRANRTTRETSGNDIKENYPDIADETETEIEERKWFKDTI